MWKTDKNKFGRYDVKFTTPAGRRIRRSTRTGDHAVAKREAHRIYREECDGDTPAKPAITFAEAATGYMRNGGERRFMAKLLRYFGRDTTIDEIDDIVIAEVGVRLYPNHASDTIRRQVHVPIKSVLNFACGNARKKSTDNRRVIWLTPEQVEPMLKGSARARWKIAFLLGTGCRTGEMFALNVKDHWPGTNEAFIADPKNNEGRVVRYPPRAAELMADMPAPEEGQLFRTPKGHGYVLRKNGGGQMKGEFDKARDAAGLGPEITPHVLRHTWATWFYAQTRDFGALMDLGGWKKADMANRYRKIAPADLSARLLAHGWDFNWQENGKIGDVENILA